MAIGTNQSTLGYTVIMFDQVDGDHCSGSSLSTVALHSCIFIFRLPEALSTQGQTIIPPRFGKSSLKSFHSHPHNRKYIGHSMVLDPTSKILYIFAGQREERYLSDMYCYDINAGVAKEISSDFSSAGGPDACFTQRAVIDPNLQELYV